MLQVCGASKAFPGVQALRAVDLELRAGEVLAVLGENGAGKSTLIKILGGAHPPDTGTIHIAGKPAKIESPVEAQRAGISIIYQEFNLIPALSARENISLGRERLRFGLLRREEELQQARRLFARLGVEIDPEVPCRDLSVAQQQLVEIAKALSLDARILVMDEPSATLTPPEVARLFAIIRDLRAQGLGLIYISHRLEEIFAIADRVLVLRDGQLVGIRPISGVTRGELIEMMVGRTLDQEFPKRAVRPGPDRLVVRNLCRGRKVRNVSFTIRRGEVLGLTGLVGAGRTEVARCLFGADRADSGSVELDGQPLSLRNPGEAIRAGLALLTEDRKSQGLVLGQSVRENFGLPNLRRFSRWGVVREKAERGAFAAYVKSLRIRIPHQEQLARNLSGGNQQKVVLAKWLERHCEVVLFDEPTRGIDIGAKCEVHQLINELAAQGKAILMISSELPEVLAMSDRVLVMRGGRIAG
ncbi:MAG: sugar ABC transporter ATP-binding protein, partial [Verrucomicrobiae bacterium]|nr:sugar ABC transporter ATP-binding protein [Verrucomicrobiae bacterium]